MNRSLWAGLAVAAVVVTTSATVAMPAAQAAGSSVAPAAPAAAPDPAKVPHYFGPWPNWANSPFTTTTAQVKIDPVAGGAGATASATVDPLTGSISAITVDTPGSGYTGGATVQITGGSATATATATVNSSGVVTAIGVTTPGAGYGGFAVAISGGGGSGAAARAHGGVDAVKIGEGGSGYTMPTVEFDLPDLPDGRQAKAHVPMISNGDTQDGMTAAGVIETIVVDDPGSGYLSAPNVVIHNGTIFDPINGHTPATATTTLALSGVVVDAFGSGYTSDPTVAITDPTGAGTGATATASTDVGAVTAITVSNGGAGFLKPGIEKFKDELPLVCDPATCPADGKYLPLAVPTTKTYNGVEADEYVIGLVQYRTSFASDLPPTLVRGYVQLDTDGVRGSKHVALQNEMLDGTKVDTGYFGVTPPQYLGPMIAATKDRPVRIVFRNLLPKNAAGDLFLPVDSTMMGSGMGPMTMAAPADNQSTDDGVRNPECTGSPKSAMCFKDDRATLHLHGGITPWISDGTPHQWITPAGEQTDWPEGVGVRGVPDMGSANCDGATDGCMTFYYTNQQSARLMFYHDHAWGITRLNVYAGEAAGYLISDPTEKRLVDTGTIPGAADTLPLIVQDKTFVPDDSQIYDLRDGTGAITSYGQDPTWDKARWGGKGSLWYHHVYMPAQNPGDPGGMSAYGRWMYGPWFWPPAAGTTYGPIPNPYFDPGCDLDKPATWQYQTDPFCEPKEIPGTPNISAGMEQFNDTPLVNGVAYPTVTLQPKSYRLRLLNAANDRFFNFQWYVADPSQGNGKTEVALDPQKLAAAQTDPNVFPTPVQSSATTGPDWVQIGTEGGFLPAPVVVDGQQPTTWITDPTRFDVGNVDKHSLLLAPAERADTVVDFSKFAGKTLILYNDAPAAFPARVPSYDYYTGAPDLSPNGAPGVLPGYGPNTRTVMQVKIAAAAPAPAFDLAKLQAAFRHNAAGTGVFESGQHPIIVGQAAYNSAYGSTFAASSNCNAKNSTLTKCDGLVRVNDTTTFGFNTLLGQSTKSSMKLEPKAIHDETNATTFDEFGRMQANLGVEAQPPTPGAQNVTLYPYVNPPTEIINASNLPTTAKVTPIASTADGTQIWRVTHNGVDTHPIHFHLYDVQVLNRVTWDNIVIPPDPNELGWKDTVRMSPLEDTIVALRPVTPTLPWEVPNSIRPLSPMMPLNSAMGFWNVDPQGNPTAAITNTLVNFGWEYVWHCHILSHEEMDMMRPVSYAVPPPAPSGLTTSVTGRGNRERLVVGFQDNSIAETSYALQRSPDGTTWTTVATITSPLGSPNTTGVRSITDPTRRVTSGYYRVVARNTVGYGGAFPVTTAESVSPTITVGLSAVSDLTARVSASNPAAGTATVTLGWTDQSSTELSYTVERTTPPGSSTWTTVGTVAGNAGTGSRSFADPTAVIGTTYDYRIVLNLTSGALPSAPVTVALTPAQAATGLAGTATRTGARQRVDVTWTDSPNEASYVLEYWPAANPGNITRVRLAADTVTTALTRINRVDIVLRLGSVSPLGTTFTAPVTVTRAP